MCLRVALGLRALIRPFLACTFLVVRFGLVPAYTSCLWGRLVFAFFWHHSREVTTTQFALIKHLDESRQLQPRKTLGIVEVVGSPTCDMHWQLHSKRITLPMLLTVSHCSFLLDTVYH